MAGIARRKNHSPHQQHHHKGRTFKKIKVILPPHHHHHQQIKNSSSAVSSSHHFSSSPSIRRRRGYPTAYGGRKPRRRNEDISLVVSACGFADESGASSDAPLQLPESSRRLVVIVFGRHLKVTHEDPRKATRPDEALIHQDDCPYFARRLVWTHGG